MVNKSTLIIIGVVILVAVGAFLLFSRSASGSSASPVPDLGSLLSQGSLPVPTSGSTIGLTGSSDAVPSALQQSLDDIKSALLSSSRTTQDALQKIAMSNAGLNPDGTPSTVTSGTNSAGQTQTKSLTALPINTVQNPITLVPLLNGAGLVATGEQQSATSFLGGTPTLDQLRNLAGVRGKPIPPNATVVKQNNIVGTLTTKVGGTRQIAGGVDLFKRLQQNLLNSQQGK